MGKKTPWLVAILLFALAFGLNILGGCAAGPKSIQTLSVGMSKEEVKKRLGEPDVVRASIKNRHGQLIEVWEYSLAMPSVGSGHPGRAVVSGPPKKYWLYLVDNTLVQWQEASDWQKEVDRLYEFRFNTPASPTK